MEKQHGLNEVSGSARTNRLHCEVIVLRRVHARRRHVRRVGAWYYEKGKLLYASKTRNGFTPASRKHLLALMKELEISQRPFVDLPQKKAGRWGQGLTAEKMRECQWLRPSLVGQFSFVEWTPDGHLRHVGYVGLREDKKAKDVVRESA